ncbi:MAG TPA: PASTA domain-containing protein [Polyangia bacterium]|nr:PASTA domain-containing protein [Polyangia bacterium]
MGRSALVAFITSLITSVAAFAALTVADQRGSLDGLFGRHSAVEVPSISGMSIEQARDLLRSRDLLLSLQAERPDPTIQAGLIAAQMPLPGSRTPQGIAIQAFVSSGPTAVEIPPLAGARPDDAIDQLRNRKLATGHRREETSDTIASGLVIATEPPAGRSVAPNTDVTLVISTGRAQKPVPKVVGLSLTKAKKVLEAAGFKVVTTRAGSSDNYDDGQIIKQEPLADALAPTDGPVNLVVNE